MAQSKSRFATIYRSRASSSTGRDARDNLQNILEAPGLPVASRLGVSGAKETKAENNDNNNKWNIIIKERGRTHGEVEADGRHVSSLTQRQGPLFQTRLWNSEP